MLVKEAEEGREKAAEILVHKDMKCSSIEGHQQCVKRKY